MDKFFHLVLVFLKGAMKLDVVEFREASYGMFVLFLL
jgi:hypothetical protein